MRKILPKIIFLAAVLALLSSPAAAEKLDVNASIPKITDDKNITIPAEFHIPSFDTGDLTGQYTVNLYVDGKEVISNTGEVSDGEMVESPLNHNFSLSGTHNVRMEVNVTLTHLTYTYTYSYNISGIVNVPEKISISEAGSINVSQITPDTPAIIDISNSVLGGVNISVKNNVSGVNINIEKLPEDLPNIDVKPPGKLYKAFNISTNVTDESINSSEISFTVAKEWLENQSATESNVVMQRYNDSWEDLPTNVTGENDTHFMFKAETAGFSTFGITVQDETNKTTTPTIQIDNITVSKEASGTIQVLLDKVPSDGLTYVNVSVDIVNSSVAEFTGVELFPEWADMSSNSTFPSSTVWFKVGDLSDNVQAGDTDVSLATVTVEGLVNGTSDVDLTVNSFQNGSYGEIKDQVTTKSGEVTVGEIGPPQPPQVNGKQPKDLDDNGLCEDANGDNSFNFGDIMFFFQNFDNPAVTDNKQFYDFNGDGNINFGDVIGLFQNL